MDIVLNAVVKRFRSRDGAAQLVIDRLSCRCDSGGALALVGPSGSGKSTLLNLIAGLLLPDEGTVSVGGTQLDSLGETARDRFRSAHLGYVFQTFNLLSPLSALENLVLPAGLAGRPLRATRARARDVLVRLGLEAHLHKRPYELSVGQRQRVAVGRALLQEPKVLLADEPTASLDPEAAAAVVSALRQLHRAGTTMVVASHDPVLSEALGAQSLPVAAPASATRAERSGQASAEEP